MVNFYVIVGITIFCLFLVQGFFFYKKKQNEKSKQIMINELNKLSTLVHQRNMIVASELKELVDWSNKNLETEIVATISINKQFNNFCVSLGRMETEVISRYPTVITDISKVIQNKLEELFEKVSTKTQENLEQLNKKE